jgi:hypothetical protein
MSSPNTGRKLSFLNMNPTLVTKDLFQSKSGKGISLDAAKTKTEKREQENKKKSGLFCEVSCGYCFGSQTNDDRIQSIKCKVCFYERSDNEIDANRKLRSVFF